MKHCPVCLIPDTRPNTIFVNGECQACINYAKRRTVDWEKRMEELKALCQKYKRADGYYDCLIPVSGGKDSHFLVHMMKEMGMNPLLVTVGDPFTKTEAGRHNLINISEAFNCDRILFDISTDLFRRVTRIAFEELGDPLRFVEAAIYTVPIKFALSLGIPLVVYGENNYEYGSTTFDGFSAWDYIEKAYQSIDFWLDKVSSSELNALVRPDFNGEEPVFLSYYLPWDGDRNYQIAKRYGFRDLTHEWRREGNIEDFDQIDSIAYIVHLWLKYPKFGFARATDIASRWIRSGKITRREGKKLVMDYDHKLDQRAMEDFISFLGYTPREFWDIVERFWNTEIFEKVDGIWKRQ